MPVSIFLKRQSQQIPENELDNHIIRQTYNKDHAKQRTHSVTKHKADIWHQLQTGDLDNK